MTEKKNPNLTKSEALVLAWKNRNDYKGYDRTKGSSFNSWRSIINTSKGRKIGFPDSWKDYNVFMSEVQGVWERGKIALRKDKTLPHSKDNTYWGEKGTECIHRLSTLEYNGETKTLVEWAKELKLNYMGLRIRYFRYKNTLDAEQILFGKKITTKVKRQTDFIYKAKHLYHSYKLRDRKKGLENDLTQDFVITMCKQPCIYCGDTERIGLDRIDNSKGHLMNNVVPCCYDCNCARNANFTFEEMLKLGKTIKQIKQARIGV